MDKISIIVPIYNVENYLSRCVDSLLVQTYHNVEIILVDDCSTDSSADIASDYAQKNPQKVRFVQREINGGLSAARNSGIFESCGDWITFVDSDDWVSEDFVETLYNTAVKDDADIVMSDFYYAFESGKTYAVSTCGAMSTQSSHKQKVALADPCSTTRLYRKTLFTQNNLTFPEDIWRSEDIATIIPVLTYTDKISLVNKPMYYYFQRKASLSNQNTKNVDLSFYPKTIERMHALSRAGFETELEFRAASELMYGMVTIMLRSGRNKVDLCRHVDKFNDTYAGWDKNPYLAQLPFGKRVFIRFAAQKKYLVLKALIFAWDLKQKICN